MGSQTRDGEAVPGRRRAPRCRCSARRPRAAHRARGPGDLPRDQGPRGLPRRGQQRRATSSCRCTRRPELRRRPRSCASTTPPAPLTDTFDLHRLPASPAANQQHDPDRRHRRRSRLLGSRRTSIDAGLDLPAGGAVCWIAGDAPPIASPGGLHWRTRRAASSASALRSRRRDHGGQRDSAHDRPGLRDAARERRRQRQQRRPISKSTPAPRNNASDADRDAPAPAPPDTSIDTRTAADATNSTERQLHLHVAPDRRQLRMPARRRRASRPARTGQDYTGLAEGSTRLPGHAPSTPTGTDPSPAGYKWTVDTTAPTATIDTQPADPSPGASAAFTFHASETGRPSNAASSRAATRSFSTCTSGKTFPTITRRRRIHLQGASHRPGRQPGDPVDYTWKVDNSLADTTAPETTIPPNRPTRGTARRPPSPTNRTSPARPSNALSTAPPLPPARPAGISYTGLAAGPHTFQVGATDARATSTGRPPAAASPSSLPCRREAKPPPTAAAAARAAPGDEDHRQAGGEDARPHADLQLQRRRPAAHLPVQARRRAVQGLPLAAHHQELSFGKHTIKVRAGRRRPHRPDARAGQLQDRQNEDEAPRRARAARAARRPWPILALGARPPSATFHLMSIREVYPGSALYPAAEYVELQMWAPGQNFVEDHSLRTYAPPGRRSNAKLKSTSKTAPTRARS